MEHFCVGFSELAIYLSPPSRRMKEWKSAVSRGALEAEQHEESGRKIDGNECEHYEIRFRHRMSAWMGGFSRAHLVFKLVQMRYDSGLLFIRHATPFHLLFAGVRAEQQHTNESHAHLLIIDAAGLWLTEIDTAIRRSPVLVPWPAGPIGTERYVVSIAFRALSQNRIIHIETRLCTFPQKRYRKSVSLSIAASYFPQEYFV